MSKHPICSDEITRLIGIVDAARSTIPPIAIGDENGWRLRQLAAHKALYGLAEHGARYRQSGDITSLSLGGIRSTSTGGPAGVMGNWLVAARKRLERCA